MKINISKYIAILSLVIWSAGSQAMTVWVVESGLDPFSSAQGALELSTGITSLDLYYDVEGDTSYGYDFTLGIEGLGSISNISGNDLGQGASTGNGWRQFGGPANGETGSSVLAFSFDFTAESAAVLNLTGSYADGNFLDSALAPTTLATVSAVPLPAAAWLFISGLGLIGFTAKKKK